MTSVLDATAGVDVADRAVQAALAAGADDAQVVHVYDEMFEITYDNNDIGMVRTHRRRSGVNSPCSSTARRASRR